MNKSCVHKTVCVGEIPLNVSTVTHNCSLSVVPHLLGDFEPCLLESEDWAAVERRRDLEQSVVIVQAAADVSHRHPLLNHRHAHVDIVRVQDLCCNPVADLKNNREIYNQSINESVSPICLSVRLFLRTSLKCLVVLIMYGVLSFLPDFIQPWPKNSLYNGKRFLFSNRSSHRLLCVSAHVHRHLLIRDDLEDQVVQQCELLSYLQSGVVLKRLCLTVQHSLIHKTHTSYLTTAVQAIFKRTFSHLKVCVVISSLTIWVISSRVTWLSPGSSWVTVLHAGKKKGLTIDKTAKFHSISLIFPLIFWALRVG